MMQTFKVRIDSSIRHDDVDKETSISLSSCLKSNFPSIVFSISRRMRLTMGKTLSHFDFAIDLNTVS